MRFRLVLQPAMSAFFAIRGDLADAKKDNPPYFWALLWDPAQRSYMLKDGWKHIGRIFILGLAIDVVYQIIELRFVYVGAAIIVAVVLAILPYLILRGLVTRVARKKSSEAGT
jgi:hypothetical protein